MTSASNQHSKVDVAFFFRNAEVGGVQRMLSNMANELAGEGLNISYVAERGGPSGPGGLNAKVAWIDLKSESKISLLLKLRRYLLENRPKYLISAVPGINIIAILARLLANVDTRVLIGERSHPTSEFKFNSPGLRKLTYVTAALVYRGADEIIAVSDGVADDLARSMKFNRERIHTIYNPAFDEGIAERSEPVRGHKWISEDTTLVVGAGRLVPQKDFHTLVRAFALVHERMPKARLVILGEGEQRQSLESLVSELGLTTVVEFPGAVSNPYSWFKVADLFVLSSRWEGFGNVLAEALGCGCNCVSTDCPSGPSEILLNGQYGTLTPVGDHQALADAIIERIQAPLDPAVLKDRGREFTVGASLARYRALMPDLVAAN